MDTGQSPAGPFPEMFLRGPGCVPYSPEARLGGFPRPAISGRDLAELLDRIGPPRESLNSAHPKVFIFKIGVDRKARNCPDSGTFALITVSSEWTSGWQEIRVRRHLTWDISLPFQKHLIPGIPSSRPPTAPASLPPLVHREIRNSSLRLKALKKSKVLDHLLQFAYPLRGPFPYLENERAGLNNPY